MGEPVYHIDPKYAWGMMWGATVITSMQLYRDLTLGETYEWYVKFRNDYAWGQEFQPVALHDRNSGQYLRASHG